MLPISTLFQPKTTTEASFTGNLPSDAAPGTEITTSIRTYDLLGTERTVSATFARCPAGQQLDSRGVRRGRTDRERDHQPRRRASVETSVRTAAGQ